MAGAFVPVLYVFTDTDGIYYNHVYSRAEVRPSHCFGWSQVWHESLHSKNFSSAEVIILSL